MHDERSLRAWATLILAELEHMQERTMSALSDAVDQLIARITNIESAKDGTIATLTQQVADLTAQNDAKAGEIADIQAQIDRLNQVNP